MGEELEWGKTPWHNMTREQLLLRVFKMYEALSNAQSSLKMTRHVNIKSPFWGSKNGSGYRTMSMVEQALEDVNELDDENREILYKGFFRNAMPLLFKDTDWEWDVCEKCKQWFGTDFKTGKRNEKCLQCGNTDLRPIKWLDFSDIDFSEVK